MGKKILAILGSPRKGGNSDLLSDAFLKGAMESGHKTEKIYIQQLHLKPCMACYGCRETEVCVQKDGMAEVLEKMIESDVILLATPVYFYSMSGQMKVWIDRVLPQYTKIKNKEFYFIATAADENAALERTFDALSGFTDCLPGATVKAKIYGGGFYESGAVKGSKAEQEAYELGKKAQGI